MDYGWLAWPIVAVYLWMTVAAYRFLRDRFGSKDGSALEAWGALYWCGILAPLMPFILVAQWIKRGRARRGVVHEANRVPAPPNR